MNFTNTINTIKFLITGKKPQEAYKFPTEAERRHIERKVKGLVAAGKGTAFHIPGADEIL